MPCYAMPCYVIPCHTMSSIPFQAHSTAQHDMISHDRHLLCECIHPSVPLVHPSSRSYKHYAIKGLPVSTLLFSSFRFPLHICPPSLSSSFSFTHHIYTSFCSGPCSAWISTSQPPWQKSLKENEEKYSIQKKPKDCDTRCKVEKRSIDNQTEVRVYTKNQPRYKEYSTWTIQETLRRVGVEAKPKKNQRLIKRNQRYNATPSPQQSNANNC